MADPKAPLSAGGQLSPIIDFRRPRRSTPRRSQLVSRRPTRSSTPCSPSTPWASSRRDFDPANPVGTGAFEYKSFKPGKNSVFTKYADYWGDKAFVDELHIQDFADANAQVNALQAGQIQTIDNLPYNLIDTSRAQGRRLIAEVRRLGAVHDARRRQARSPTSGCARRCG